MKIIGYDGKPIQTGLKERQRSSLTNVANYIGASENVLGYVFDFNRGRALYNLNNFPGLRFHSIDGERSCHLATFVFEESHRGILYKPSWYIDQITTATLQVKHPSLSRIWGLSALIHWRLAEKIDDREKLLLPLGSYVRIGTRSNQSDEIFFNLNSEQDPSDNVHIYLGKYNDLPYLFVQAVNPETQKGFYVDLVPSI